LCARAETTLKMNLLRKYQIHILVSLLSVFLFYIAIGAGTAIFGGKGAPTDTLIEVDGHSIPLYEFYTHYNRALGQVPAGTVLDKAGEQAKREEVIRDLVQGVVFQEQAEHFGIDVPDRQVASSLTQIPAFQDKGVFSGQAYMRALQYQLKTTPKEFEEEQRAAIARFKLNYLIRSSVKLSDQEFDMLAAQEGAALAKKVTQDSKEKRSPAELKAAMRDEVWQEKVLWSFNQWYAQLGQHLKTKTHFDLLQPAQPEKP
jgi:hypothetical protein